MSGNTALPFSDKSFVIVPAVCGVFSPLSVFLLERVSERFIYSVHCSSFSCLAFGSPGHSFHRAWGIFPAARESTKWSVGLSWVQQPHRGISPGTHSVQPIPISENCHPLCSGIQSPVSCGFSYIPSQGYVVRPSLTNMYITVWGSEVREIALWLKHSLPECEDQSSGPQNPYKCWISVAVHLSL